MFLGVPLVWGGFIKIYGVNTHHFKTITCILLDGLLFHLIDCSAFLTSYSVEMANLAALHACFAVRWVLPWWMCTATVLKWQS